MEEGAAAAIKAGINQFLDRYRPAVEGALQKGLVSEAAIDKVLRGNFRVMIKLGLLDPPERVSYSKIGQASEAEPWLEEKNKTLRRR